MAIKQLQVYAGVAIAAFFLAVIWQLFGRWEFSVSVEPLKPEVPTVTTPPQVLPVTKSTPTLSSSPTPQSLSNKTAKLSGRETGALRVANLTQYPVRLALLPTNSKAKSSKQPVYGEPAHWDFEPGEGGSRGLVLALPDGNLKLNKGDVVVAFSQDGSRRYWGPYIVGETPTPTWNNQASEWQLVLH
jgi:hypothetical protein